MTIYGLYNAVYPLVRFKVRGLHGRPVDQSPDCVMRMAESWLGTYDPCAAYHPMDKRIAMPSCQVRTWLSYGLAIEFIVLYLPPYACTHIRLLLAV